MVQKEEREDYQIGKGMSGDIPFFACFFQQLFGQHAIEKAGWEVYNQKVRFYAA